MRRIKDKQRPLAGRQAGQGRLNLLLKVAADGLQPQSLTLG